MAAVEVGESASAVPVEAEPILHEKSIAVDPEWGVVVWAKILSWGWKNCH